MLRSTDQMLLPAVKETVAALEITDKDAALIRLAEHYAATIDNAAENKRYYAVRDVGPLLLSALQALGATPVIARTQDKPAAPAVSKLAALRAAHHAS
jgi:hypothetical protein